MSTGRLGEGDTAVQQTIFDAKADLLTATAADTPARLAVGTNNHTLIADSSAATGLSYAAGSKATLTTTGDILYASSANTPARLGIGSSGQVLTVASGVPSWGTVDLTTKTDKSTLTTTGDIYYASSANTPERLGIGSSGQVLTVASGIPSWASPSAPNFRGCSVHNDFNTNVGHDTNTIINMNLEHYDTDNFHDNVTNNSRITIPAGLGGYYLIISRLRFDQNATAERTTGWYLNGVQQAWVTYQSTTTWGGGGSWPSTPLISIKYLSAGDYVQTYAMQHSGGTIPVGVWEFTVARLGG